ncbi:MAG: ankyrin repeat domain-containing protein [Tenacibaculum sp.]
MKKLFLSTLIVILSSVSAQASKGSENLVNKSIATREISTFCKMIRSGNYENVKALINNGTDINRKSLGLTPLMYAARYNRVDILKLLIKKGARLSTKSKQGHTALDYAKMSKATEAYDIIKNSLEK